MEPPKLVINVSAPAAVEDIKDLVIATSVINVGQEAVTLIITPRNVLDASSRLDKFEIKSLDSGHSPRFRGFLCSKIDTKQAGRIVLGPGARSTMLSHTLAHVYDFASAGAGAYEIRPRTRVEYLVSAKKFESKLVDAETKSVVVHIAGNLAITKRGAATHSSST